MEHPEQVGPWKLEAPIGQGGMANVYRAVHTENGSVAALKVFNDEFTGNEEYVRRAQREVVALTMCAHPNIPRVLGHDIRPDGGWVAIECVRPAAARGMSGCAAPVFLAPVSCPRIPLPPGICRGEISSAGQLMVSRGKKANALRFPSVCRVRLQPLGKGRPKGAVSHGVHPGGDAVPVR